MAKPLIWRRELCFGPELSNHPGNSSSGAQPLTSQLAKIHRRRSLQCGHLHEHTLSRPKPNQLEILIDRGPSFDRLLNDDGLETLLNSLKQWCMRSSVRLKLRPGPSQLSWGKTLWHHWHQQTKSSGSVLLFISDLHGPLPSGPIWRHWLSSRPIAILQGVHPTPQTGLAFRDAQKPRLQQHYCFWDDHDFRRRKQDWNRAWKKWSRKQGIVFERKHCNNPHQFLQATQEILCGSTHSPTTV